MAHASIYKHCCVACTSLVLEAKFASLEKEMYSKNLFRSPEKQIFEKDPRFFAVVLPQKNWKILISGK